MATLADPSELETHLQRPVDPAVATLALELASGAVRSYCGWSLTRESATFYFEGDGRRLVTLPTLCLIEVFEVRCDGEVITPDVKWSRKGQGYSAARWARYAQYEVDVDQGYDLTPDVLKMVTLDLAARQTNNPQGLASATTGQVTRVWNTRSTADAGLGVLHQRLLDAYSL